MSKYRTYERKGPPRHNEPHPIWRGIGCLIMLIVPVLSFGISTILVQMAPSLGIQIPVELLGRPLMPDFMFQVPGMVRILNWIQSLDNLYAILVGTFTVTVILAGVLALGYAIIYRFIGPPLYSNVDVPSPNIKVKKYKR
jgi:hypothetical protein